MSAHRGDGGALLNLPGEGEDKEAVDGHKSAVVNYEKRNEEQFGKVFYRVTDLGGGDFEDVVEADGEIFRPV